MQIRASVITHCLKHYNLRQVQYMAGHKHIHSSEQYNLNKKELLILQLNIVTFCIMTKKEKLIARFLSMTNDFHYNEVVKLQGYFNFKVVKKRQNIRIQGQICK
jgi:hypothetical protein